MSWDAIAVEGLTLDHASGSLISGGAFVVTSAPSAFTSVDGRGVYFGPLAFTFAGGNAAGCVDGSVAGGGAIDGSAAGVLEGGLTALVEGDSVTMAAAGVSPGGAPVSVSGAVEITNAGQNEVLSL